MPGDILGKLPNLQYFGAAPRRPVKGRCAILDPDFDSPKVKAEEAR